MGINEQTEGVARNAPHIDPENYEESKIPFSRKTPYNQKRILAEQVHAKYA